MNVALSGFKEFAFAKTGIRLTAASQIALNVEAQLGSLAEVTMNCTMAWTPVKWALNVAI